MKPLISVGWFRLAVLKSDTFAGIWGFPKMVVPKNMGFPTKNDHFGVEIGGTTI